MCKRHFYWRQLRDMKGSALVEAMSPLGLEFYARICGWTLARAHARSGDPVAIAEYLGDDDAFDRSITEFSERYADQNEQDFQDVREGRPIRPNRSARGRVKKGHRRRGRFCGRRGPVVGSGPGPLDRRRVSASCSSPSSGRGSTALVLGRWHGGSSSRGSPACSAATG